MKRSPEPELMLGEAQARAYAEADFAEPHGHFIELFDKTFSTGTVTGYVLDLGCGPADISLRFARKYPDCVVHGVDGSEAMLSFGRVAVQRENFIERVELFCFHLPSRDLPRPRYDLILSNSLLHHLNDPQVLWETVKQFSEPGTPVFVMDLMRPPTETQASEMVGSYTLGEPEILKADFCHSLLAAYSQDEVESQLKTADLMHLTTQVVSDRHLIVCGFR